MTADAFGQIAPSRDAMVTWTPSPSRPHRCRWMHVSALSHRPRRPRRHEPQTLMTTQAEGLQPMATATIFALFSGNSMGRLPIGGMRVPWSQSPIVTRLTLPLCMTSKTTTGTVGSYEAMVSPKVHPMLQSRRLLGRHETLRTKPSPHPSPVRFVTRDTGGARLTVQSTFPAMATQTGRLTRQSFRATSVGAFRNTSVALPTTDFTSGVLTVRKVQTC